MRPGVSNDKCTCGPNVYGIEATQLFGKKARTKGALPSDIDSTQENNQGHAVIVVAPSAFVSINALCGSYRCLQAEDAGALGGGGEGAGVELAEDLVAVAGDDAVAPLAQGAGDEAEEGAERSEGAA